MAVSQIIHKWARQTSEVRFKIQNPQNVFTFQIYQLKTA